MSRYIISALVLVSLSGITHAGTITIAAGDLATALFEYAEQFHVYFTYDASKLFPGAGFKAHAIRNETDPKAALDHLLLGSGFKASWIGIEAFTLDDGPPHMLKTRKRPGRKAPVPLAPRDGCRTCPRSVGGEPLGPWCRDADEQLIYAPGACGH